MTLATAPPRGHGTATAAPKVPAVPPAPAPRGRPLTDAGALALAVAVACGAWFHHPVPLVAGVATVGAALAARRPWLLVLGGFLLASALGARSMAGLDPARPGAYAGPVTLVADPQPMAFGTRVDVRVGARRVELWATDGAAGTVATASAGERLQVTGRLRPPRPGSPWLVPRHVVGRIDVTSAERMDGGSAPWRAANRFRRLLGRGAESLPEPDQSLYGGFVLGDDRGQLPELVDDFRGAGLTHLLVVSGQNVAFVLVLASPLTSRLRLGGRWAVTVGVIALFGVVTRFEPSVLRASAMAALGVSATLAGRPVSPVRILALAVAGLVLVDPLLVRSVGFQLSVGASAGIALLAHRIAGRLPGPVVLAEALGVTIAAQLGVAPVLIPRFGDMPVVALVANVVAVPAAGLVTTWGLPAGVVAGLAGGRVAALVHAPTHALIWWVAAVARRSAAVPLGELHLGHVALIAAAAIGATLIARHRPGWRSARLVLVGVVVATALAPAAALRSPPGEEVVAGGGQVHRGGGATILVLSRSPDVADLMAGLRRAGVRRLDLVVAAGGLAPDVDRALRHRWPLGATLDPETGPAAVQVGSLRVDATSDGRVQVRVAASEEPGGADHERTSG